MPSQTVGQILRSARQQKGLSLISLAKSTRIRIKVLRQLEADQYHLLPEGPTRKGLIRNYARALELNPDRLLGLYRRDFEAARSSRRTRSRSLGKTKPPPRPRLDRLPWMLEVFFSCWGYLLVILLVILTFFAFQLRHYYIPPRLTIEYPISGLITDQSSVLVSGRTNLGNQIVINSQIVTPDKFGQFASTVPLVPGVNRLEVVVTGPQGKSSRELITVYYEP